MKEDITTNATTTKETTVIKKEKEVKYSTSNVVSREPVVIIGWHVCRIYAMSMKNDVKTELYCQTVSHCIKFISITKSHVSIIHLYFVLD